MARPQNESSVSCFANQVDAEVPPHPPLSPEGRGEGEGEGFRVIVSGAAIVRLMNELNERC